MHLTAGDFARWTAAVCVVAALCTSVAQRFVDHYANAPDCSQTGEIKKLLRQQGDILAEKQEAIDEYVSDALESMENFRGGSRATRATRAYGACTGIRSAQQEFNVKYNGIVDKLNEVIENARKSKEKEDKGLAAANQTQDTIDNNTL